MQSLGHQPPGPQLRSCATTWPQTPSPVISEVRTVLGVDTWQLPWTSSSGWLVWRKQWRYVSIYCCPKFSRKPEKLCVLHLNWLQMQRLKLGKRNQPGKRQAHGKCRQVSLSCSRGHEASPGCPRVKSTCPAHRRPTGGLFSVRNSSMRTSS